MTIGAYNIAGVGGPQTNQNIAMTLSRIWGDSHPNLVFDRPSDYYEIPAQSVNDKKFRKRYDWEPKVGLEEGLQRTVDDLLRDIVYTS